MLSAFLLCGTAKAFAAESHAEKGKELFQGKCSQCHSIGGGRKVGPDLQGISERRPKKWLEEFISDPEKMFRDNDPVAANLLNEYKVRMPALGLSKDDVEAILDFIGSRKGGRPPARTVVASQGDAATGKKLFTGETVLKNGGAPCLSCHNVAGMGFPGGGSLGPDLTRIYSSLGDGMIAVFTNIPFPTMVPIFRRHPIDSREALDLAAFLKEKASYQPEDFTPMVLATAITGFFVLMIVTGFAWRHRLVTVREKMVKSSRGRTK